MITYRSATKDDLNFILSSWLQSFKENLESHVKGKVLNQLTAQNLEAKIKRSDLIDGANYFYYMEPLVKLLLKQSNVLLATDPDDPTHLIGWVAYQYLPGQQPVIHYLYTKAAFRKLGVAASLLALVNPNDEVVLSTFNTHAGTLCKPSLPYTHTKQLLEAILL